MKRIFYPMLALAFRLYASAGRRLSPVGLFLAALLAVFALVGSDTKRTAAFQGFAFLFFLLGFSALCSIFFRGRFSVSRRMGRTAVVGEPFFYDICVKNESGKKKRGLLVQEKFSTLPPPRTDFLATRVPGEEKGAFFSRSFGLYRFYRLATAWLGFRQGPVALPGLADRETAVVRVRLTPMRRGRLSLSAVSVLHPDPLGLSYGVRHVEAPADLLVLPRTYPVRTLPLGGTRRLQAGGVALAGSVGDSQEFCGLRDYRPGDPLRHIHWKSFAKLGKPVVKEFCEEFFVRHALVLDTFAGDGDPAVFEEAVSVAASFARAGISGESLLDLLFVGPQAYRFTFGRGLGAAEQALSVLACVSPCRTRPFSELFASVMSSAHILSGAILVLLNMDEERRGLCASLAASGIPLLALVLAPGGGEIREEAEPFRTLTVPVGQAGRALAGL